VVPSQLPRSTVLPDLDRSRAVLVCHGDGRRHGVEQLTAHLAEALTSPDAGRPFHPWRVQVLINSGNPSEVVDAVGRAADEATDVLLYYYSGEGERHERFVTSPAGLNVVAELMSRSPAVRPVAILDGDDLRTARACFTSRTLPWQDIRHPISLTLLTAADDSGRTLTSRGFTAILAQAMTAGIRDGPAIPELADLQNAINVEYLDDALGVTTESMAPEPGRVTLHRGYKTPRLALSVNRSASPPYQRGALSANADEIYEFHRG
jgi:hypothetical protein